MSDDTAACPHSLAERETAVADGMCPICSADALSRLTTPQLPNDIARLIKITPEQEQYLTDGMACLLTPLQAFKLAHKPLADALRALALENAAKEGVIAFHQANEEILDKRILMLAQENERLKREEAIDADTIRVHAARIRELEAERDEAKADYLRRHKDVGDQMDRRIKAEAERDAIRKSERALSDAYVRLRVMIPGALDTPHAPTSEQIWNITEKALSRYAGAIRAKTIEDAKRAIVRARFGPPSHWGGDRPEGWHLDRPCAPEEAAMHDNGCNDAFAAVRALAQTDETKVHQGD